MLAGHSDTRGGQERRAGVSGNGRLTACLDYMADRFFLKINSRMRKCLDFVQFVNLLYIALVSPIIVAFELEMSSSMVALELVSLLLSVGWVIGNLRTQVLIKGVPTLKIQTLLKHYMLNGLVADLCGTIPF